ncbi:DEAD/DEAH box helicase [Mycolicibacterium llatzerense]|uniref:DEAD/DEAH box helicase n=1 Tax=Mycolicibacterium llatzerense TaxID=280871 RepID=UPI0021B6A72A|nr:DEAD/DEAH box helicase [Mycolicibacterium llatzerense]MCT7372655.1 hypothetical protein [Mycolicibacterium llatzerense]
MPTLRDYQTEAIQRWNTITADGGTRASMILPTGTGKTVVAAQLIPHGHTDRTVFFVPTVVLLEQTCRHLHAAHPGIRLLRVCSATAPALDNDDSLSEAQLAARQHITATTDPDVIAEHLRGPGAAAIVATYASAPAVTDAAATTSTTFALCICDEAHRTAGAPDKAWSLPVRPDFPARQRLFMTATARTITVPTTPAATAAMTEIGWDSADIISMDSPETYGPHINTLSFRDAIAQGHLSDYTIALIGITSHAAHYQLARLLANSDADYTITDAAAHLALARAAETHPHIHSVLAFHNRIAASRAWTRRLPHVLDKIAGGTTPQRTITAEHIDGDTDTDTQRAALTKLAHPDPDELYVVSNCRVFAEGVDVPALDAVLFAAPRTSGPDIVQIIGRAIRPHPHSTDHKALVIVPVLLASEADDTAADLAAARTSHLSAWRILTSLADQDELLHQSLLTWRDDITDGAGPNTGPLAIDLPDGLDTVAREVFLRTIDKTIPTHLRTAAYLADYYAVHGHTRTRPTTVFRNFPLGTAFRAAKAAYRAGTLPQRIAAQFEKIDQNIWATQQTRPQRTADQWIDLVGIHIQKTGMRSVERWTTVTDPENKQPANIGAWYYTKALRKGYLTTNEHSRLKQYLPSHRSS